MNPIPATASARKGVSIAHVSSYVEVSQGGRATGRSSRQLRMFTVSREVDEFGDEEVVRVYAVAATDKTQPAGRIDLPSTPAFHRARLSEKRCPNLVKALKVWRARSFRPLVRPAVFERLLSSSTLISLNLVLTPRTRHGESGSSVCSTG